MLKTLPWIVAFGLAGFFLIEQLIELSAIPTNPAPEAPVSIIDNTDGKGQWQCGNEISIFPVQGCTNRYTGLPYQQQNVEAEQPVQP